MGVRLASNGMEGCVSYARLHDIYYSIPFKLSRGRGSLYMPTKTGACPR